MLSELSTTTSRSLSPTSYSTKISSNSTGCAWLYSIKKYQKFLNRALSWIGRRLIEYGSPAVQNHLYPMAHRATPRLRLIELQSEATLVSYLY